MDRPRSPSRRRRPSYGRCRTAATRSCDVAENLRFFTRLPLGPAAGAPISVASAGRRRSPGALIGALGACAFLAARALRALRRRSPRRWPSPPKSSLTGALHEDGLADVADGFGGGRDRDAKLAILRDSRIGTYGALALGAQRAAAHRGGRGADASVRPRRRGGADARGGGRARRRALAPLAWLPPARSDGAGAVAAAFGRGADPPGGGDDGDARRGSRAARLGVVRALFACVVAAAVARLFVARGAAPNRRPDRRCLRRGRRAWPKSRRCWRFSSAAGPLK